jgi:hypothetical protein
MPRDGQQQLIANAETKNSFWEFMEEFDNETRENSKHMTSGMQVNN